MTAGEWEEVESSMLSHTVNLVDSDLVEADEKLKEVDLVPRILGEYESVEGDGRQEISNASRQRGRRMTSDNDKTMLRKRWRHKMGLLRDSGYE